MNLMHIRKGKPLIRYEIENLVVFLLAILTLGSFATLVFQTYRTARERLVRTSEQTAEIILEKVTPEGYACAYYVGVNLTEASHTYRDRSEIPATDDGLVRGLLEIEGVVEVVVDRRMVLLTKSPSARWGYIQSRARKIINHHFHMHP
jgi:hypothetical protein